MNAQRRIEAMLAALALPADARVEQWVPKKLLLEQGALTPADKRRIQEGIDEVVWFAALKPTNIGVTAYCDEVREYLEIAVIAAQLSDSAKASRLAELLHRAIPYPVVLVTAQGGSVSLSLAHKRWSLSEAGRGGGRGYAPHSGVPARFSLGMRSRVPWQPCTIEFTRSQPVYVVSGMA